MINQLIHTNRKKGYGILRIPSDNTVTENITLSEAKDHLRVTNTDDDTYITTLISVARSICEEYVGFILARNSKLIYYLEDFPQGDYIYLFGIAETDTVDFKYYDTSNSITTWASSNYSIDKYNRPAGILLNEDVDRPELYKDRSDKIVIQINNAGYLTSELPKAIHQAILMTIGHLYENRQDVVVGSGKPYDMPKASEHLLNPFRVVYV